MTVRPTSRRWGAVVIAGALVLAACGSDDDADDPADATDTAGVAATAPDVSAGDATPLDGVSVVVEADGSRTITHAKGTTTIPAELPERIVVTGDPLTDSLVSLGVTPSAATADYGSEFTRHLAEELEGVEVIEWVDNGVNIEQLAATQPDLIITEVYGTPDESWDAVSQIAPTISMGDPWAATSRDVVTALGMVFGLEDEAEAAIAEYDAAVAEASSQLGDLEDQSLALVLVYPDELRLVNDSNGYLSPVLFGDLGLIPFEYPGDPDSISPELVGELTADVVVLQPDFDGTDLLAQVVEQPLVQNLPAAQNDQLFVVDDALAWQTWSAVGLQANTAFLQDFVALLTA